MNNILNILVVEDESHLALEFATCIKNCDFNVVNYVTTAKEARECIQKSEINLIVMGIDLGGEVDGIDLYKEMQTDAFVIYLTAYKDDSIISRAVETEPLGYLIKPLNESELLALLKLAQIKIQSAILPNYIMLPYGYSFDIKSETLYYNNQFVKLSAKKAQLLKLLIEAKGKVVSFDTIEEELWKENPPSSSALRTLIYRLRKDMEHSMIESELNYGIRLIV